MRWGKVALADQEWRNWCGNTTGMTKILAPGSWKWMPSCEQCSSLRAFGASSNACWSSSQRWTHNGQKLPLLLSKRPLHFWNWEPSQPSKVVQAITVGLALLKTKDTDQSLCQHNFTAALWWNYGPWNALWGLERLATTHKRFQIKQEQCSHDRDPALSEMKKGRLSHFVGTYEKGGSSILLLDVLLHKNTPTKDMRQQSHVWKLSTTDSSAPSVLSTPSCTSTRSSLVILGKSSLS